MTDSVIVVVQKIKTTTITIGFPHGLGRWVTRFYSQNLPTEFRQSSHARSWQVQENSRRLMAVLRKSQHWSSYTVVVFSQDAAEQVNAAA